MYSPSYHELSVNSIIGAWNCSLLVLSERQRDRDEDRKRPCAEMEDVVFSSLNTRLILYWCTSNVFNIFVLFSSQEISGSLQHICLNLCTRTRLLWTLYKTNYDNMYYWMQGTTSSGNNKHVLSLHLCEW